MEIHTLNDVKNMFFIQGQESCFGLWEIIKVIKEEMGIEHSSEVRRQSMIVVKELLDSGMCAGSSPYNEQGEFIPWEEDEVEIILEKIEKHWDMLGREPNIPDSPWFISRRMQPASVGK